MLELFVQIDIGEDTGKAADCFLLSPIGDVGEAVGQLQ